jgi:hypothetical protein
VRRAAAVVCVLFVSAASSGCLVLSLQPAYDAESVAFDEGLLGRWVNADDETQATIERGEWRSYKVTYTDRFATRLLQANLTRLDAVSYLDITEQRGSDPGPFLLPVHGLVRIDLHGDTMTAALFDYPWFGRAIEQKSLRGVTATFDDRRNAIIASPTADLRRWLARVPDAAIAAPMTFKRQR